MARRHRSRVGQAFLLLGLVSACAGAQPAPPPGVSEADRKSFVASPDEERQRVLQAVEASGASEEAWTRAAAAVFQQRWMTQGKYERSALRCYQAACTLRVTYTNAAQAERFQESLVASEAFLRWPGAKYRSPVESLPDGKIAADWVLFRPEGGA